MTKTIRKKKKCKKAKRLSEEALQIAEKRREVKGKEKRERHSTECGVPKDSKNSKESLIREQCKEIEENNRMGKIRDLFKKIKDIKGTFHAKMDTVKERSSKDLTEAEEIRKRWRGTEKKNYAERS